MKMIEMQSVVDGQGQLIVPAGLLRDMGLASGDTVKLAYISSSADSIRNTFKKFVLTPHGIACLCGRSRHRHRQQKPS